jgi:hypothetical protein
MVYNLLSAATVPAKKTSKRRWEGKQWKQRRMTKWREFGFAAVKINLFFMLKITTFSDSYF